MTAIPVTRSRNTLPVMLIAQLVFVCGLAIEEPWISFFGIAAFVATYMLGEARREPAPVGAAPRPVRAPGQPVRRPRPPALATPASHRGPAVLSASGRALRTGTGARPELLLRPIVPLGGATRTAGWFGGCPSLPPDTDWPHIEGKPALFLAQLDCARLPPGLWGGRGPRDGWLRLFRAQAPGGAPLLLHTADKGDPCQPPAPLPVPGQAPMREDILARATGRASDVPRWPVEIVTPGAGTACLLPGAATGAPRPDPAALALTDRRLQPFDWPSAMILLEVILSDLDWQGRVVSALGVEGPDQPGEEARICAFLETIGGTIETVSALKSELVSARDQGLPFDDRLRQLIFQALGRLVIDSGLAAGQSEAGPDLAPLLEHDQVRRDYVRWLDRYAMRLYCDNPRALPAPQRALFESLWSWRAHHECGGLGGNLPDDFTGDGAGAKGAGPAPLPILSLPGSALLGWNFGGRSSYATYLAPQALAEGDFSAAFGETSA